VLKPKLANLCFGSFIFFVGAFAFALAKVGGIFPLPQLLLKQKQRQKK
jgi:hypothetical protein